MAGRKALLIVDVQNDFCPGGALAVPGGDEVARPLSELAAEVARAGGLVLASRDWHPPRTKHFRELGGKWPPHCVQGTQGAQLHPGLALPAGAVVVSKGMDPDEDAYSAFQGRDEQGRPLEDRLREAGVRDLYVGGLATDYCVRFSAKDALQKGFSVAVLTDAVRAVDPEDGRGALEEIARAGGRMLTVSDAVREVGAPRSS